MLSCRCFCFLYKLLARLAWAVRWHIKWTKMSTENENRQQFCCKHCPASIRYYIKFCWKRTIKLFRNCRNVCANCRSFYSYKNCVKSNTWQQTIATFMFLLNKFYCIVFGLKHNVLFFFMLNNTDNKYLFSINIYIFIYFTI